MRILCFGRGGLLATELEQWLCKLNPETCHFLSRLDCDITQKIDVDNAFEKFTPTIVINAAAYTNVDECEDEQDIANEVNGHALKHMVLACNKHDATLVHFSTDYIFNGTKSAPYIEDDQVDPINKYGESKLIGEELITKGCNQYYILRVQWVFGVAKGNFIQTMLNLAKKNSEIRVVNDQIGSPTSTTSIAKAVVNLLTNIPEYGVYHFRSLNHCTWYEYACYIFEQCKLDVNVIPVSSSEFKTKATRPKNSVLNIGKWIYSDLYKPLSWKQAVTEYLESKKIKE